MGELSYPTAGAAAAARSRLRPGGSAAAFALGALGVLGLGAVNGGYFPSSWGWALVAFAAVVVWAPAVRAAVRPERREVAFLGGLLLLACWYALSATWSTTDTSIDEAFRALVYAAGAAAALHVCRRVSASALLAGVLGGSTAIAAYALATRLFPERLGTFDSTAGYRLAAPIGYWNALGLLCAIALVLAAGLAASAPTPLRAALAAAPAPVLLATLYFTFGRGAWISLGFGVAIALALDPRRLRLTGALLALGVPAAIGVFVGSRSAALTHQQAAIARAAHDGHRLALLLAGLTVVAGALAAGLVLLRRRVPLPARASRLYALALAALALSAAGAGLAGLGGPVSAVHRAWHAFSAPPPQTGTDLRKRLFSFSGTGRADLYRAAWADFRAHPLAGSGAGSFEAYWLANRPNAQKVRDAHSLYLETLAELGIAGLALLVLALGAPLVAAARARARPGVAAAAGAYAVYLLGAAADWDWEITAVTLAAVFVGAAVLVASRPERARPVSRPLRLGTLAAALAVAGVGFVFLVGNMLLARGAGAARAGNWTAAARDARRAQTWLPWSTAPWQQLGEAQLGLGNTAAAQVSFHTALGMDAADWNFWFDLARATSGRAQQAALARAKALDPLGPEIAELETEIAAQSGSGGGGG